jgi:diguanylate cyclase (GGDEF)-like protein
MPKEPHPEPPQPYHPDVFAKGLYDPETRDSEILKLLQIAEHDPETARAILEQLSERAANRDIDVMTGLPDKTAFWQELNAHAELFRRSDGERGFDLLVTDLAGFKAINKEIGHSQGDMVLQLVATRFENYRSTDRFFRWGGDEFTVIVPEGEGNQVCERLGEDISTIEIEGHSLHLYCGVSSTKEFSARREVAEAMSVEEIGRYLFDQADARMREHAATYKAEADTLGTLGG